MRYIAARVPVVVLVVFFDQGRKSRLLPLNAPCSHMQATTTEADVTTRQKAESHACISGDGQPSDSISGYRSKGTCNNSCYPWSLTDDDDDTPSKRQNRVRLTFPPFPTTTPHFALHRRMTRTLVVDVVIGETDRGREGRNQDLSLTVQVPCTSCTVCRTILDPAALYGCDRPLFFCAKRMRHD